MRSASTESSQGGRRRLVAPAQQPFKLFPLHDLTPVGILLYSNQVQQPHALDTGPHGPCYS
ncbi:hypothetical protein ACRJ4B_21395 [Streptomyces sp. GTA36]